MGWRGWLGRRKIVFSARRHYKVVMERRRLVGEGG